MMVRLREKLKRHFWFSSTEWRQLVIVAIAIGFFYSFRNWGNDGIIIISMWFGIFLMSSLIAFVSYFLHLAIQRVISLELGYQPKYELNYISILISLMAVIASNGVVALILPGWQTYHIIPRYRRKWPPLYNTKPVAWMTASGIFVNLFIAGVASSIAHIAPGIFWDKIVFINLGLAVYTLLPVAFNDGLHILYGGILHLLFTGIIVAVASILILSGIGFFGTLILTLLIGCSAIGYYIYQTQL